MCNTTQISSTGKLAASASFTIPEAREVDSNPIARR
jgi:hypothetical protein